VQVANPVSFLTQKILIQDVRDRKDRAKDILYIHDTIETFAGSLAGLQGLFAREIQLKLPVKRARAVSNTAAREDVGGHHSLRVTIRFAGTWSSTRTHITWKRHTIVLKVD
jgi:ABC-type uncharacterized transport system ATPase subunit